MEKKFSTLKKQVLLFLVLFLSFSSIVVEANTSNPKEKNDRKTMFKSKVALSVFPSWLSDQLLHRHIPFTVNLAESDYLFNRLAYADTLPRKIDLVTDFTLTKSGRIEDCTVANLPDTAFANEVKRVISLSGKWQAPKEEDKKMASDQHFTIPLDLKGDVVVLEKGPEWGEPDKRIYGKNYNLTRYVYTVAMLLYNKNHSGRVDYADLSYVEISKIPMYGTLELSFVVDKEGRFSDLRYINHLHRAQLDLFLTTHMYPGRLFNDEVKWAPAIRDGEPVGVQVRALIDYDKKEFSWDCYVMDEK